MRWAQWAHLFFVRPAGRTHLEVKVLYTPDTAKCARKARASRATGGLKEAGSKALARRTGSGLRRRCGVSRPKDVKPGTCTERRHVDPTRISVKVGAQYPGRSGDLPRAIDAERCRDGWPEVSRGHSSGGADACREGPNLTPNQKKGRAAARPLGRVRS
jgi:hypothetical protein